MPELPCFIAVIAAEDVEFSVGRGLAGLLVMAAMAGSVSMIVLWAGRIRENRDIFPAAERKPLIVPAPLLLAGIVLTVLMSLMVLSTATTVAQPNVGTASAEESETPADRSDMAESDAEPKSPVEADVLRMMMDTLSMNLMMFSVFGLVIWLSQQSYSRRLTNPHDLSYGIPRDAMIDVSDNEVIRDNNPYTPPSEIVSGTLAPLDSFIETSDSEPSMLEVWNFRKEIRFAAEAVVVAYLPTAMLRIILLSLLPDSPSHPFLEMMEQGINWPMMSLIAFMAILVAPAVEELLYRVTILGGCMQQNATMTGWVVSSVLFAFAHGFPDSIALLPLAFAIGYTYIRRRSYRTVMLIHLMFNAFNMIIAVISLV